MNYRWMIHTVLAASLLTGSGIVFAHTLTLDGAVAHALQYNPDLNAAEQQLSASTAQAQASKGEQLPTLTLTHTARVSDNPLDAFADKLNTRQVTTPDFDPVKLNDPSSSDLYWTQLSLRYPLYTGGRVSALVENAEHSENGARLQYQRARELTAFATIKAYLSALTTEHGLAIADDAVNAAKQHASTTTKLASEERIVESDKLAAQVNLAAVRSQREQAETRYRNALDELKLVTGMSLDDDIQLVAANISVADDEIAIEVLEKRALELRKDLAAARAQVQAASARTDAARAVHKPSIDLVASTNWYDDKPGLDNNSSSLMGVLKFDLYDAKSDGEIDSRAAQQRQAQWELQALEQSVQKQVRDARNSLIESKKRLVLAQTNVDTAKQTVKLVKQRYGQGRTILLDLLQAERLYTDARIEKLTAQLNLDLAQYALPLATGEMSATVQVSP